MLPFRRLSSGTVLCTSSELMIRESLKLKKKNALSRLIGPPMLPPNWFWIRLFLGMIGVALLLNQLFATSAPSR